MKNLLLNLATSILNKLVEKYLTPDAVEKYSDQLIAIVRKAVEASDNKYDDTLLPLLDILDEVVGK